MLPAARRHLAPRCGTRRGAARAAISWCSWKRKSPTTLTEDGCGPHASSRRAPHARRVPARIRPENCSDPKPVDGPCPSRASNGIRATHCHSRCASPCAEEPKTSASRWATSCWSSTAKRSRSTKLPAGAGRRSSHARRTNRVGDCCDPPEPLRLPLRYRPVLGTCRSRTGFRSRRSAEPPPMRRRISGARRRCVRSNPREAMPQVADAHGHRSTTRTTTGSCSATCWPATARRATSWSKSRTTARAPALRRRHPRAASRRRHRIHRHLPRRQRRRRQRRRARPSRICARRRRLAIERSPIRCPPSAASTRRTSRPHAAMRRRPSARRSAR